MNNIRARNLKSNNLPGTSEYHSSFNNKSIALWRELFNTSPYLDSKVVKKETMEMKKPSIY